MHVLSQDGLLLPTVTALRGHRKKSAWLQAGPFLSFSSRNSIAFCWCFTFSNLSDLCSCFFIFPLIVINQSNCLHKLIKFSEKRNRLTGNHHFLCLNEVVYELSQILPFHQEEMGREFTSQTT